MSKIFIFFFVTLMLCVNAEAKAHGGHVLSHVHKVGIEQGRADMVLVAIASAIVAGTIMYFVGKRSGKRN
jgi:hypothetical protein